MPGENTSSGAATDVDVAIVGAGLSGTIAAIQLGRIGYRVGLLDLQEAPRPEFRAEQLVGRQIGRLAELGLLDTMTRESRHNAEAVNGRRGKLLDRTRVDQYGVPYHAMVGAVRTELPDTVRLVTRRVAGLETGPDLQQVSLADGTTMTARLVVLATGLATVLSKRLGIEHDVIRAGHSLALGFDVVIGDAAGASTLPLVYYGENARDRVDYLALFPMHDVIRANLFCYQEQQSEWTRAFCRDPYLRLLDVMPGLRDILGDFSITSPVQVRSNDLRVASDPARDGVVLVGDAFQTPCPAAGTGIDRLLSDVDLLCERHIPAWFASSGMGRTKIATFYADPAKQAYDAECLRIAAYRREVSTRENLWWNVHRKQVFLRRRIKALMARRSARQPTMPTAGSMAGSH